MSTSRDVNWSELHDAYGPATAVGPLLERLVPDVRAKVWDELWSRICHQGSVYSASFAAIPFLTAAAASWRPSERGMALSLAGAIFAGDVQDESFATMREAHAIDLDRLRRLADETSCASGISSTDLVHVMQAILAFDGVRPWCSTLDQLASEEFEAVCPACDTPLFVAVGEAGCFTAHDDYATKKSAKRVPIEAVSPVAMRGVGKRLHDYATRADQNELADRIAHLFGTATCSACGERFDLAARIEAESE